MKDSVIIVSGGMDSITLLYDKKDEIALGISFNYGSNHNEREIPFAKMHCERLGIKHITIDLGFMHQYFKSSLLEGADAIPEGHYAADNMKRGHWGIFFNVAGYASFIDITPTSVDDDHISCACPGKFGANGQYFYNWGQMYMIYALTGDKGTHAANVAKTYKVELIQGTTKQPSSIKLTDESNPNNWFVLTTSMPESLF